MPMTNELSFPEEFYRGRSPLGREVALAITGEAPGAQALEGVGAAPGVPSAPFPEPGASGSAPSPAGPTGGAARPVQPGGALPQILRGIRLLDQLRRLSGTVGAPLTHERSPGIESAWQAQRFGEFAPQYQSLLAAGWTPGQIQAAQEVLGPMQIGERLTPQDISALQSLFRGDVVSMPPDIAAQFLDPELFTTAAREAMAPGIPLATTATPTGAGAQTLSPAMQGALASSLIALPATIGASDPYIQRTLASAYGPEAATALNLIGALGTPFTFGASAFLPIVGAALASMFGLGGRSRYWRHRRQAAEQLQGLAPLIAEVLPLARSRKDVEWLANLINRRVRGWRLTPEGLEIHYRELAKGARPLQEYVQHVLGALPSLWESPDLAQEYFAGQPTVSEEVARRILSAWEAGDVASQVAQLVAAPGDELVAYAESMFGPTFAEQWREAKRRGEPRYWAGLLRVSPDLPEEQIREMWAQANAPQVYSP